MAGYEVRGEMSIGKGFFLGRMTTAERSVYMPTQVGAVVMLDTLISEEAPTGDCGDCGDCQTPEKCEEAGCCQK